MFLVLLPLVVVAAVVAVVIGVSGRDVVRWAGVAVVALVVLSLVSVLLLAGFRGGGDEDAAEDGPSEGAVITTIQRPSRSSREAAGPPAPLRQVDAELRRPDDSPFPSPAVPLGGLADEDAIFLEAALDGDAEVRQCPADSARRAGCGAGLAVPAPADGTARFLFVVEEDLLTPTGSIDCSEAACVVVLFGRGGDEVIGQLSIVFGTTGPRPEIRVSGDGPFSAGEAAVVALADFPPGEEVVVTQCTPPGPADQSACGAPAPEVTVRIDAGGQARTSIPVHLGPVGAIGHDCRRSQPCAIAVLGASVPTPVVELSLAGSSAAHVGDGRIAAGLLFAALLVLACAVLVARGDWNPPDGDPFEGIVLRVPEGWEHLLAPEDDDVREGEPSHPVTE